MNLKHILLSAALAAGLAGGAHAASLTWTGDTTGGPVFDRPLETLDFLPLAGRNAHYNAFLFTVDTPGEYSFQSTAIGDWDNFTVLYAPSFVPTASLMNALVANDDNPTVGLSGFSWDLTPGVTYTFVTTGLSAAFDFGAYSNTIDGPGIITEVPEPRVWLLMVIGLAAVGWMRRSGAGKS